MTSQRLGVGVVHDGAHIIRPDEVDHAELRLVVLPPLLLLDVVPVHGDVLVSVGAGVLVPEPQGVDQLVQYSEQFCLRCKMKNHNIWRRPLELYPYWKRLSHFHT